MARTSRRRRGTSTAVKARQSRPPGVTYSTEQVQALLATSQRARLSAGNTDITPLATSPFWSAAPFGPGFSLVPKPVNIPRPSTGRPEPRLDEYPVSWNIQIGGRRHVPWKTLTDAAQMPLFRKCIERRKGVCSLGFTVTVDPKAVAREAAS